MTGYALATALAAPVEDGMMLALAARPARQSPFMLPAHRWQGRARHRRAFRGQGCAQIKGRGQT